MRDIEGIPFFGLDNNAIYEDILAIKDTTNKTFESMYDIIKFYLGKNCVVVIDNRWLTWLTDIRFNYRDTVCVIPYYTYETEELDSEKYKYNDRGHLLEIGETLYVRYNYKLEYLYLDLNNLSLDIADVDTMEKQRITTSKWFNSNKFSMEELYQLYLDSCFSEDEYITKKHLGGYHYIDKFIKNLKNIERNIRKNLCLESFKEETDYKDYRDVRNYKYAEVISRVGIRDTKEHYKIRRLRFESLLYCILRNESTPYEDIKFEELGKKREYIKYGSEIKLILKSYWLNNFKAHKVKSWSRFNMK